MVKLTLRLEWLERLEQVTKGQIYQPYLSTPGPKRAKVSGNSEEIDGNKPKRAKVSGNFSKKYVK